MMVLPLALVASGLLLARGRDRISTGLRSSMTSLAPLVVASYFCALLGFLTLAYLSRSQPVIWVRYGLILFVIGLPLAAWMLDKAWLARHGSPSLTLFRLGIAGCDLRGTSGFGTPLDSCHSAR